MSNPALEDLRSAFSSIKERPYCEGSAELKDPISKIFYQKDGKTATIIDFIDANDDEIKALADACQPASFGLNKQEVLDESYRKAGKMDNTKFATLFNPRDSGILDAVVSNLVRDSTVDEVVAELYKLNVYGPGSFFKPHVDTPRSDDMFGSLVVVLPTKHEGGTLVFRHSYSKWKFDSAAMLGDGSKIVYAAFLGDVEHEVLPVISGYRVTLTYNLYSRQRGSRMGASLNAHEFHGLPEMRDSLTTLLQDKTFLSYGGYLIWGLSHRYPVSSRTLPSDITGKLRGVDAITYRLCNDLGLEVSLKAVYRGPQKYSKWPDICLVDEFFDTPPEDTYVEEELIDFIVYNMDGQYCVDFDHPDHKTYPLPDKRYMTAVFVKPIAQENYVKTSYIAYGNEPSLESTYGEVCVVAMVSPAAKREA